MTPTLSTKETQIRANILQAAQQLFQQYGLFKVTMEDVAQAIGKGKSTLYYYYKSKEEIFDAVIDLEITQALDSIQVEVAKTDTAAAQLKTFYLTKFRQMQRKMTLYRTLSRDIRQQGDFLQQVRRRYMLRETTILKRILEHGLATGEFGALAGQNLEVVVHALISSTQGMEYELLYEDASGRSEAANEVLLQLLIAGMKA